jgi:hypothetical protein
MASVDVSGAFGGETAAAGVAKIDNATDRTAAAIPARRRAAMRTNKIPTGDAPAAMIPLQRTTGDVETKSSRSGRLLTGSARNRGCNVTFK